MTTAEELANPADWPAQLPTADLPDLISSTSQPQANKRDPLRQKPANQRAVSILPEAADRPPEPTLLTLQEVAAALGISVKSVQRRIKAGVIRKAPIGGRLVRISADELRRLTTNSLVSDKPEDTDPI
jgi:excisionase family DNA binding protein